MNRALSLVLAATLLLTLSACGKKSLEPAGTQGKNVLSALKDLGHAYEKKDLAAFQAGISDGYQDRDKFSNTVSGVFAKYASIRFNIQFPKLVIMAKEGGQTKASFNWDAEWLATGGTTHKDGGRATFVYDPTTFKLVRIEGKNPFLPVKNPIKQ